MFAGPGNGASGNSPRANCIMRMPVGGNNNPSSAGSFDSMSASQERSRYFAQDDRRLAHPFVVCTITAEGAPSFAVFKGRGFSTVCTGGFCPNPDLFSPIKTATAQGLSTPPHASEAVAPPVEMTGL